MEKQRKNWGKIIFGVLLFVAFISGAMPVKAAVKLSETDIVLLLGEGGKDTCSLEVSGAKKGDMILFSSKDEAVAVVDKSGKITAVSPGSTTIICTITDTSGKKTRKKATVRVYDNIKSISLGLKKTKPNALFKNKTYQLSYTCKTAAGANKNTGNYIYYEVLTRKGKTTANAWVELSGKFTAKKCATYIVYAYVFQDEGAYQNWANNREKYKDSILAKDEITLTVTTKNYKKTERKVGNYSINLPEGYEITTQETSKDCTLFLVQVKNSNGYAISNIQVMSDQVDEAEDVELLAAALSSTYTKESLQESWKLAYNAKKATVKNLNMQSSMRGEQEIFKISYELTLKNIVIPTEEGSKIKIDRMDFVNTIYTWYDGKTHRSIVVTDALESLQPNITEVAAQMFEF